MTRHLSSVLPSFPLSKLANLYTSPISSSPFPNLFILWCCGRKLGFSIYNRVCDADISLRPVRLRNRGGKKRNDGRDEDWLSAWRQCLCWSIAPCIPDRCGPINRYQSTMSCPRWPEEETPLQFLEYGSFVFELSDIWRFRTRLVSRFTTEVGWFTPPSSIFWIWLFFLISPTFVDTGDNRKGLSAACNKFEVSRTYMLEISAVLRKFLCFRRRKTCLEFNTAVEYFMSFERCL